MCTRRARVLKSRGVAVGEPLGGEKVGGLFVDLGEESHVYHVWGESGGWLGGAWVDETTLGMWFCGELWALGTWGMRLGGGWKCPRAVREAQGDWWTVASGDG